MESNNKKVIYSALIPLDPTTKKNSQQIIQRAGKRPLIIQSEKYRQYARDAAWFLRRPAAPIAQPVNVRCLFYRGSNRRVDLTNLLEAIDDILVEAGVLQDDNFKIVAAHDGSRVFVDPARPRTEIYIEIFDER